MTTSSELAQYQPASDALKGKIIIITGAGDGIGKSAATSFAKHGATIILLGRTLAKLEAVYDEIEASDCAQPAIFPINFESATDQDYQALHEAIKNEFGRIDGILHNAAELGQRTMLAQYSIDTWQKLMQVNTTAPFMLTKHMLPLFDKETGGSIVFTGSSVGRQGKAYWGAYSVSKSAIENLMQVFASEFDGLGKLRANSINPGAVRTQMRATAFPAEDPTTVTDADSLMNRYVFLFSDDSQGINGQQFDAQPS